MQVTQETSPANDLRWGHTVVGMTAVKLCESFRTNRGILVRAPGTLDPVSNSACVWIGGKSVTADSEATGGVPLPPGQSIVIPTDDPSKLFVISTSEDQDVAWMGV